MIKSLQIEIYKSPILKKRAFPVGAITPSLKKLIQEMIVSMELNEGVGLAAPQVGISQRIIIVKDAEQNHGFLNPEILSHSKNQETDEEGCLSLPGIFLKIKRAKIVEVLAQTPQGKTVRIQAKGLGARIFQHEIDHLNGKLIIDRISPFKRFQIRKKLKNLQKGSK